MSVPTADTTFSNFAVKVFPYFSYSLSKPEKVFAAGSTAREKISNKFWWSIEVSEIFNSMKDKGWRIRKNNILSISIILIFLP